MVEKDPHPTSTLIATMIEIYSKSTIQYIKDYINLTDNHDKMGDFRGWLLSEKNRDLRLPPSR